MKKIIVLTSILLFSLCSIGWAGCNFSAFTKHPTYGVVDGQKTYDLYYATSPDMTRMMSKDVIMVTFVLDYTSHGRTVRMKGDSTFPVNTRIAIQAMLINIQTGEFLLPGIRYLDFQCEQIKDVDFPNALWITPDPGTMGAEFVKIGRSLAGTRT